MNMTVMKFLIWLCAAGILLTSGCASIRVKTDLMPDADPDLKSSAGKFYIAELKYNCDDGVVRESQNTLDVAYKKDLLRAVRKECPTRYPLLFSEFEESAIPLCITVDEEYGFKDGKFIAWMLCTLMITPMILPAPLEINRDLTVSAGLWNGTDGKGSPVVRNKFRREQRGWVTMLTPLALIPAPGESDFPKESEAFNMGRNSYDDVPQVAQQVTTAIAKMIAGKDTEFWTAQPRRMESPSFSPVSPSAVPATLTLPTETIAPF